MFLHMNWKQQVPNKTGSGTEKKEVLLEDHDPIWFELRDVHVADVRLLPLLSLNVVVCFSNCIMTSILQANLRLHEKMSDFISKNKAAQLHQARLVLHSNYCKLGLLLAISLREYALCSYHSEL
jgi:hypothetical protein